MLCDRRGVEAFLAAAQLSCQLARLSLSKPSVTRVIVIA
jgi:hypothetical protein